jgi:ferrous iron transport protein A
MERDQDSDSYPPAPTNRDRLRWQGFLYTSQSAKVDRSHQSFPDQPPNAPSESDLRAPFAYSLTITQVGDRVQISALNCDTANNHLMGMGLIPGAVVEVISRTASGSVIVAIADQRLGIGAEMAQNIQVIDLKPALGNPPIDSTNQPTTMQTMSNLPTSKLAPVKLRDAAIGATLRVMGYELTARDHKCKLLAMGLTPGTELTVTRHAPLGDPTEISVRGFQLSLRKAEADALIVTPIFEG